jgi:hypothetical protein
MPVDNKRYDSKDADQQSALAPEGPGSHLGPVTRYPSFSWFSSLRPQ